jgi:hypothetical protein
VAGLRAVCLVDFDFALALARDVFCFAMGLEGEWMRSLYKGSTSVSGGARGGFSA